MSAYQTEGNNINTDWHEWEQNKKPGQQFPKESCGIACDSYNRYEQDFDLCVRLNNNAVRISLEWARIQPTEDTFDQNEISHYKKVLKAARDRGLKTFVTLHHFTNPLWFYKKGGWTKFCSAGYFEKYAKKCASEFGDLIDVFFTINEPQVYTLQAFVRGMWPPNKENPYLSLLVQFNMANAHKKAYKAIKSVSQNYQVGIVKNIVWYMSAPGKFAFLDKLAAKMFFFLNNEFFLFPLKKHLDMIGLNYYFTTRFKNLLLSNLDDVQSDLGWWVYPLGLEKVLLSLKKYGLPIYITENGAADCVDRIRTKFIRDMLISVSKATKKGVNVKGYFYWSLIDNFEWHEGFWPKFGLVYIDRENNLMRKPRESFYYYADICDSGKIVL